MARSKDRKTPTINSPYCIAILVLTTESDSLKLVHYHLSTTRPSFDLKSQQYSCVKVPDILTVTAQQAFTFHKILASRDTRSQINSTPRLSILIPLTMVFFMLLLLLGSAACVSAQFFETRCGPRYPGDTECGKVNIVLLGLPPSHKLAEGIPGLDASAIDKGLRDDAAAIMNAGYNLRVILISPADSRSDFQAAFRDGTFYQGIIIRYELRQGRDSWISDNLGDMIDFARVTAPVAPIMWDNGPGTALRTLRRSIFVDECPDQPGKDLGYIEICTFGCNLPPEPPPQSTSSLPPQVTSS
ncbi:hypothetical protein HYALB_00008073 [Hymenoscyphus albidus]|uniref:Uncharacterized protein n=1 Tax=Hymenoscyphus albidus TaxID=595503 RepID=A0A9N9LHH6_9HELO|nr:hypothetical protein HYALB_00008073 [Hymenoscyphus albidus]